MGRHSVSNPAIVSRRSMRTAAARAGAGREST